ncbi:transcriptional regulator [Geotalea uraniireducens]|uniref:Transcriptional regulator n=1 Tax=Geotalea uraniireducens TaxID=351604 RepID=A0ABN6VR40_9BACT|nr:transcriptional regulator [Geotalea uraniireducens]BDV41480.1 transcriptional regulator [Geotalea uraniireducens]
MRQGKPAKKYSQAGRVHDLIRLIEARHGVTLEEMAEETGVDRRTVHRDLNVIHEAGYPLVSEWLNGRKVYRFLTRFKDVPPITFTLQELMALSFFRSQLHFLDGTPFRDDLETVFRKINSVLPPRYAAHMERIADVSLPLLQGRRDYRPVAEPLRQLREALIYQYRVNLAYRAKGKGGVSTYVVDPYTLIFYKGGLYLVGYAHNRQAIRTFAAERIASVELEKERFEMPDDYQPEERLKGAFGIVDEAPLAVRIRFSPEVAHAVRERIWHPSQQIESGPAGSIVLAFTAGGVLEIISWLLSYGNHAELLEPVSLRAEVARIVADMAAKYLPSLPADHD